MTAVGIVAKLAGKLKAEPDLADQKLREALGEVATTLMVVDNAVSQFMSLGMVQGALTNNSQLLLHIEAGNLSTEVERGRGHCHVIEQIYSQYLDKWFEREFKKDEYDSVKEVFTQLGGSDTDVFYLLERMVECLEKEARVILDFVLKGEEECANTGVLSMAELKGVTENDLEDDADPIFDAKRVCGNCGRCVRHDITRISSGGLAFTLPCRLGL